MTAKVAKKEIENPLKQNIDKLKGELAKTEDRIRILV